MRKLILVWLILASLIAFTPMLLAGATTNNHIIPTSDFTTLADVPPSPPEAEGFYQPRTVSMIVIHHSGSFPTSDTSEANAWAVQGYANYHKFTVHPGVYGDQNTWALRQNSAGVWYRMEAQQDHPDGISYPDGFNTNNIDYPWLVGTDGLVYKGRDENTVGWHATNWGVNLISIGICFVGCFDLVGPNNPQYMAGVDLLSKKMELFQTVAVFRHSDFSYTDCPGYVFPFDRLILDAKHWTGIYEDVGFDYWAHDSLATLGKKLLLSGYADRTLRPDKPITRAEFVTLLWRSAKMPVSDWFPAFPDTLSHWASTAINWAVANNIVQGYPNKLFMPDAPITRAEIAKILATWLGLPTLFSDFWDVPSAHWAAPFIGACEMAKIVSGYEDGSFKPENNSARAEAFVSVDRSMK